jgi:hypothetical protein
MEVTMLNIKIKSFWQCEYGSWDEGERRYVEKELTPIEEKEIEFTIINDGKDPILKFIGGPTGHESYYIRDLIRASRMDHVKFYICAGTINSYPSCYVLWEDVEPAILEVLNGL